MSVIFDRNTLPLYGASLISKAGDFAYEVVFVILAIELLDFDLYYLGLVYFFRFIPYLCFGPVGGWLADTVSYKRNMLLADVLRFITAGGLYITYVSGYLNIYVLIASAMVMTIGRALFQPSFRAYLPSVLEKKDLPAGNSFLQIIEDVASIFGPLVCSLVIAWGDKGDVILIYALTYFMSVLLLFFLKENISGVSEKLVVLNIFAEARVVVVDMFYRKRNLFMVIVGTSICVLFTASLLRFVLPASIINIYEDEKLVGYIFSLMSLGTVLGGVCYTRLVNDSTPLQLMKSWAMYGMLFLAVSIIINYSLYGLFCIVFFLGFSGAIVDISIITNIQSLSEERELGKNYGIYSTIANTCEAASGLVSGMLSLILGAGAFSGLSIMIAVAASSVNYQLRRGKNEKKKGSQC
ncbi:Major Facilitator Superfamily protein [Pseudomonas sp. NFACC23-1]|uniref:MFS transporter n=1 Tax=unclassified Pseudomonas TaxID=196821 RepID=UPI0008891A2C|nr:MULTISPECIES: MFS transporter [unclassified Pseudomonas]SDB66396.1 Major Facilitator Superfamily protein [Pseudomonas sp. NFACC17-2]SEJ97325.1 Major Facilitator Superfamily protein [Pseudomonas sp. NFACC23-1]SFW92986.1 Major Facilitator Superfamily protein [Pseudomonas sp. NFACC16-2]